MVFETTTRLAPEEVIDRAKRFFAERVPLAGAFVEKESARHVVLRGQGGEEVVVAASAAEGGARVRASTVLFSQPLRRFLSTLPPAGTASAA